MKKTLSHTTADCQLFVTVTLPKAHHRKDPPKQAQIMLTYLKRVQENMFDFMTGSLELTQRGIVHAHFLGKYKEGFFEGVPFANDKAKHKAYATAITVNLKRYSICDVQIIKCMENVETYIGKDLLVTEKIIERKATFLFFKKPEEYKPSETLDQLQSQPKEVCTSCLDWEINIINDSFKK